VDFLVPLSEPPVLPSLTLPGAPTMPAPVLEVPRALLPSYKPLVVPPSALRPPPGIQGSNAEEEEQEKQAEKPAPKPKTPEIPKPPKEVQMVEVPFTDVEIPMPSTEIMTAAATTAVISVAATLTATSIFKYLVTVMKPVVKTTWNKITKKKK
jgi:hypothetical protein